MYYDKDPEVNPSALKHGVTGEDALAAATSYLMTIVLDQSDSIRELRIGFDTRGRLLEIDSVKEMIHLAIVGTVNGKPVTDTQIQEWADEAERGYDVSKLKFRGRPSMGESAAKVTTLRLEPALDAALSERAQKDQSSRSQVIRDALRAWLESA